MAAKSLCRSVHTSSGDHCCPPRASRPGTSLPARPPTPRAAARARWPRPAAPPGPVRTGPAARAPLTREAAALAVAPAPLQHKEGVGPFRHPQRISHQHLLRPEPHRGAARTGPGPARRKRAPPSLRPSGAERSRAAGAGSRRSPGGWCPLAATLAVPPSPATAVQLVRESLALDLLCSPGALMLQTSGKRLAAPGQPRNSDA